MKIKKFSKKPSDIKDRIGAKPILHKIHQNEAIDLDTIEDFLKAQRLCQNEKS